MYGASSFPTVSTGFSSGGNAMLPAVSNVGEIRKMSPLDSMKEVFIDIRDGIDNLSKTFSEKISGLNKHLAFRLDKLNTTMTTIGKIAAKDLNIEQNTFKEMQENERRDERNEAINRGTDETPKDEGKGVLTQSFKDLLDKLTPKTVGMKLGLAGLALAGTMAALSSIEGAIAGTFEFIKKTLAPAVKRGMTELKKDFKNLDEGLFGKEGLVPILSEGFSDIYDGIKEGDFTKSVDGLKKILGPGVTKLVSVTGDAVVGVFDAVAKTFGYDGDALEKTQEWFRELPNNIDRYVDEFLTTATNVMNDLKKTYNEEGFFAATKQGATGLFDSTVGLGLNYLKDGAAAIADHYGQDEVAKELAALDFSSDKFFESIKNLAKLIYDPETGHILGMDFPNISNLLPTLREIADSIVASLPKWMRPDTLAEQIAEKQENIQFQKNQIASGDDYDGFLNKRTEIIANEEKELAELQRQYDEQYPMPLEANAITNNNNRIEKTNVLKSVSEIRTETGASPVVTIMKGGDDNKNIISQGDNNIVNMRPDALDGPTKAIEEAMK